MFAWPFTPRCALGPALVLVHERDRCLEPLQPLRRRELELSTALSARMTVPTRFPVVTERVRHISSLMALSSVTSS